MLPVDTIRACVRKQEYGGAGGAVRRAGGGGTRLREACQKLTCLVCRTKHVYHAPSMYQIKQTLRYK